MLSLPSILEGLQLFVELVLELGFLVHLDLVETLSGEFLLLLLVFSELFLSFLRVSEFIVELLLDAQLLSFLNFFAVILQIFVVFL